MPRIFEKNFKINVIEYGTSHARDTTLEDIKAAALALLARIFHHSRPA